MPGSSFGDSGQSFSVTHKDRCHPLASTCHAALTDCVWSTLCSRLLLLLLLGLQVSARVHMCLRAGEPSGTVAPRQERVGLNSKCASMPAHHFNPPNMRLATENRKRQLSIREYLELMSKLAICTCDHFAVMFHWRQSSCLPAFGSR
ncbi:uncharacterized protein K489DRAFT_146055 [Dissoconium aciculare CBS 342.82]|uniref:Uncharacterized protein n=1 Tax=Dissoconium aciculare CBS 342.82 TaxID=1314786 RepID=A0A6J3MAC2_9PEZI|nr:uncharacterized protein K489DRAFT_146055 [Dissoconium aciculare CBS 342.82]KAF1824976.1 hypothetical protein K489DRAFT_146055 [Dissoconium aciculare CBS 342.82]